MRWAPLLLVACTSSPGFETAPDVGADTTTIADTFVATVPDSFAEVITESAPPCVPGDSQCSNCIDDDSDGLIDELDPECTGPRDNDERTFGLGIPLNDPCVFGCAFDGVIEGDPCRLDGQCMQGSGNPKCEYNYAAAADEKRCPTPSEACIAHCRPKTPENCDCFGCCLVRTPTESRLIRLSDTCTWEVRADSTKCETCRMAWRCVGGSTGACGGMFPPCDEKTPCAAGRYCLTGCCILPGP
jgi:hypothetical protein